MNRPLHPIRLLAAALLAGATFAAQAGPVTYSLDFSGATLRNYAGDDIGLYSGGFTLQTAAPITAAGSLATTSCFLSANAEALYGCDTTQDFDPDGFGTGKNYIGFRVINDDLSGGGTGFLFFDLGSFLADGIYNLSSGPITDSGGNGYGSFAGTATLTVSGISEPNGVPEPSSLALAGIALLGVLLRRQKAPYRAPR